MNAFNDATPSPDPTASAVDMDTIVKGFLTDAAAIEPPGLGASDALLERIVTAGVPAEAYPMIVDAMARATMPRDAKGKAAGKGLDARVLLVRLRRAAGVMLDASDAGAPEPWSMTAAEAKAGARRILAAPDVLRLLNGELQRLGVVGGGMCAITAYVACRSRHRPRPLNVLASGPSGTGKSHEVATSVGLVRPDQVYTIGDGSERFLIYDRRPLTGQVFYMMEATPLQRENTSPLSYAMRTLMSDGRFRYQFTDFEAKDDDGRPVVSEIVRCGPCAVLITTTSEGLHPEIETRMLRTSVDPGEALTEKILAHQVATLGRPTDHTLRDEWRAFDHYLSEDDAEQQVSVPWSQAILDAMKALCTASGTKIPSRARRDFQQVLTCLETIVLLNRHTRQCDSQGRFVAEKDDWIWTQKLLDSSVSRGATMQVTKAAQMVFLEMQRMDAAFSGPGPAVLDMPSRAVGARLGIDPSSVTRSLRALAGVGLIQEPDKHSKTRAGQWVLTGQQIHTGAGVLPTWRQITAQLPPPATAAVVTP